MEPIFIFPKILAGKQGRLRTVIGAQTFQELSQADPYGDTGPHTKQIARVSLCVLTKDGDSTALSYGEFGLAGNTTHLQQRLLSAFCGTVCRAGGTPNGFPKYNSI